MKLKQAEQQSWKGKSENALWRGANLGNENAENDKILSGGKKTKCVKWLVVLGSSLAGAKWNASGCCRVREKRLVSSCVFWCFGWLNRKHRETASPPLLSSGCKDTDACVACPLLLLSYAALGASIREQQQKDTHLPGARVVMRHYPTTFPSPLGKSTADAGASKRKLDPDEIEMKAVSPLGTKNLDPRMLVWI